MTLPAFFSSLFSWLGNLFSWFLNLFIETKTVIRFDIDIIASDPNRFDLDPESKYFYRLLEQKKGRITKNCEYKVDKKEGDTDDNVYVIVTRSLVIFNGRDKALPQDPAPGLASDSDQNPDQQDEGYYTYRSLDHGLLGSDHHGCVKDSSVGISFNPRTHKFSIERTPRVIKKQKVQNEWGYLGKKRTEIDEEAQKNYELYEQPGARKEGTIIQKTYYHGLMHTSFGYTVMPKLEGFPFDKYLSSHKPMSLNKIFSILMGVLSELKRLEEKEWPPLVQPTILETSERKGWAHCDLKPGNVMVDDAEHKVTLFDFFTATTFGEGAPLYPALYRPHTPPVIRIPFVEVENDSIVSRKFDVYSFAKMVKDIIPSTICSELKGWEIKKLSPLLIPKLESMLKLKPGKRLNPAYKLSVAQFVDLIMQSGPGDRPSIDDLITFFREAHRNLRGYFISKINHYIGEDKEAAGQNLELATLLQQALQEPENGELADLNLTKLQCRAIQQGGLGIIFKDALISGFFKIKVVEEQAQDIENLYPYQNGV